MTLKVNFWALHMNSLFEKLFASYGASVLQDLDRDYDENEIAVRLEEFPVDKKSRLRLEELFFGSRYRWSVDAFALGLHLGLSLLYNDVRRGGPQQVQ